MTGNDHGTELLEGLVLAPPDGQSLWSQFKELLRAGALTMHSDVTRLLCGCELPVAFDQYITDGAGARNGHFRSSACSDIDCSHITPQEKALRQLMHIVLGIAMMRFGSFPGFRGQVVDKLVVEVMSGCHPLDMKQLAKATGILGRDPYHSLQTPMDAVRVNPGIWHQGATWALFWLQKILLMISLRGTLKVWHSHMMTCVRTCGTFSYWPLPGGGFSVYGKDADDLRQWLLLCSGVETFSCDNPMCVTHKDCKDAIGDDGRVHFIGPEQTVELDFIMQVNSQRLRTFDECNTEVFWRRATFLPVQGLAHDNHVATIFGPACLNTKCVEATYLFPAMIDEVLTPEQTLASTYEKPIEREHDLAKNNTSRTYACKGGNGDPDATREASLRRSAFKTAVQKMRRRGGNDSVVTALISAKEEPDWSKDRRQQCDSDSNVIAPETTHTSPQPVPQSINTSDSETTVDIETIESTLGSLTEDQHQQILGSGLLTAEQLEEVREAQAAQPTRWNVQWKHAAKLEVVTIGPECTDTSIDPQWDIPLSWKWSKTRSCLCVLRYGGNKVGPAVHVMIDNGSRLVSYIFIADFSSFVAIDVMSELDNYHICLEFCQPLQVQRKSPGSDKWVRCDTDVVVSTSYACHMDLKFLQPSIQSAVIEGIRAMSEHRYTVLLNTPVNMQSCMDDEDVHAKRQMCATANNDPIREFINPHFKGLC